MMYPNYYQNPYMPPQNYQPVYQPNGQQMSRNGIAGRIVNDFDSITANDVPMDGSYAIFPKSDMSELQIRRWNANGQIEKTCYKPQIERVDNQTSISPQNDFKAEFEDVRGQIGALHEEVTKISEQISKIPTSKNSKSEVTS